MSRERKPKTMKRQPKPRPRTNAQILLEIHLDELGLRFQPEYKFHPERDWKFDYLAWRSSGIDAEVRIPEAGSPLRLRGPCAAIEIEGGIFENGRRGSGPGVGRHLRGLGYLADMQKYREAAALGFKVFRFSPQEVLNGTALEFLKEHLAASPES